MASPVDAVLRRLERIEGVEEIFVLRRSGSPVLGTRVPGEGPAEYAGTIAVMGLREGEALGLGELVECRVAYRDGLLLIFPVRSGSVLVALVLRSGANAGSVEAKARTILAEASAEVLR